MGVSGRRSDLQVLRWGGWCVCVLLEASLYDAKLNSLGGVWGFARCFWSSRAGGDHFLEVAFEDVGGVRFGMGIGL